MIVQLRAVMDYLSRAGNQRWTRDTDILHVSPIPTISRLDNFTADCNEIGFLKKQRYIYLINYLIYIFKKSYSFI